MNIYISHSGNYDYKTQLYNQIKSSELAKNHHFFLPHEPQNVDTAAKGELLRTDLLVAEVSYASTGQGIELGLASHMEVPIICFYKEGTKPSGSLRFVTDRSIAYTNSADLLTKLQSLLL